MFDWIPPVLSPYAEIALVVIALMLVGIVVEGIRQFLELIGECIEHIMDICAAFVCWLLVQIALLPIKLTWLLMLLGWRMAAPAAAKGTSLAVDVVLRGAARFGGIPLYRSRRVDRTTVVETVWLRMVLDYETGGLSGAVLRGACAGLALAELSEPEAFALLDECGADPQSGQLLEAWLDREGEPFWRARYEARNHQPEAQELDYKRATELFGLEGEFGFDEFKRRYRELMARVHPDAGGSTLIAQILNEAADVIRLERGWA